MLDSFRKAINSLMPQSVGDVLAKYGGDKKAIGLAVQKKEIDPTLGVMAGMAVDRIVNNSLMEMQGFTDPTVAQETFTPKQPAPRPAPKTMMASTQQPNIMGAKSGGLARIPVRSSMYDMAGGGIVAFQAGGGARNPRLIGALENVLAQLQAKDPGLNVDYVRRAVLSAPVAQQQQLMQQLVERVGMEDQFKPAVASFTEALKTKEVDPKVMSAMQRSQGLRPDEMATPSPTTKEAAGLAAVAQRDANQADTGAQPGARPGVKDFTGSEVYAGIAQRAGNIYEGGVNPFTGAADIARSGMDSFRNTFGPKAKMGDEGIIEPSATDFLGQGVPTQRQVDPFSATERFTGSTTQTDPGEISGDLTTSDAIIKKDKELAEKKKQLEAAKPKPTAEKPAAEDKTDKPKTYDDYVKEVMNRMGKSTVGAEMRKDIEKDRAARKEAKQEAMWMSLVEAGLGIMGGESPYAAVNIGKGATNAMKNYADRLREQKKLDREDRKILLDLERAERAEQRDNYKLASELYSKSLDRMSAEKRSQISADATKFAAQLNADVAKQAYSMMKPQAFLGEERQRLALASEAIKNLPVSNPDYRKMSPTQKKAAEDQIYLQLGIDPATKKFMYGQAGGAGVNTSASGPVLDYSALMGIK